MQVTLVSSFAEDIYLDAKGNYIKKEVGGPARFLADVLERLGTKFSVVSGALGKVSIKVLEDDELGRIDYASPINLPDGQYDLVIISTLANEFKLRKINSKLTCLDIQGYVRDTAEFGKKKLFEFEPELVDIVKATERELQYLPTNLIEKLKKKILLVTRGSVGFTIYSGGKEQTYAIEKVIAQDTVGAGDTFFAAFCISYYQTKDINAAAKFAQDTVYSFLKNKEKK